MAENPNGPTPISVTQALNQIQSWLNAGEFEKVIQGCEEILDLELGNQRALALMKKAMESKHEDDLEMDFEEPAPPQEILDKQAAKSQTAVEPEPIPEPEPDRVEPEEDPLASLQVEEPTATPEPAPEPAPDHNTEEKAVDDIFGLNGKDENEDEEPYNYEQHDYGMPDRKKLALAIVVPALLVVVIGGTTIWALSHMDRGDEIADNTGATVTEASTEYLDENENRVEALVKMANLLDENYEETGNYPQTDEIENFLTDSDEFSSVPTDDRHGQYDKAGKLFGYTYAIYDTEAGENTAYILSALFEDSQGFGYAWSRGASTNDYEDYRSTDEDHATFIADEDESSEVTSDIEIEESEASDSEEDSSDESLMGPKVHGPKVNSD
jgi:hypothetical protein